MNETLSDGLSGISWQDQIRAREEAARLAFLKPDLVTLDEIFADSLTVNSPLQKLVTKSELFDLLRTGRIRHLENTCEIEYLERYGEMVVTMGHDLVIDAPDRMISRRRYTNIWKFDSGSWRLVARHAHVVSREAEQSSAKI